MLEAVNALPSLIKEWKANRDFLYHLIVCGAALLTIAAYISEKRPSEVLAGIMWLVGASNVASWFETGLPPLVAQPDAHVNQIFAALAGLTVVLLVIMPFFNAKRDDWPIELQAQGILGARAAYTAWLLLMIAAQFGSLKWIPTWVLNQALSIFNIAVILVLIGGVLFFAAHRLGLDQVTSTACELISKGFIGLSAVLLMTALALVFAAISPLFSASAWLLSTESDAHMETKRRVARKLAD